MQFSSHVGLMRFLGQSGPRGDVSLLAKEGTETSCCCCCSRCLSSCSLIRPVKRPSSLFPPLFFSPFSPLLFFTLVFSLLLSLAGTQRRAAEKRPTGRQVRLRSSDSAPGRQVSSPQMRRDWTGLRPVTVSLLFHQSHNDQRLHGIKSQQPSPFVPGHEKAELLPSGWFLYLCYFAAGADLAKKKERKNGNSTRSLRTCRDTCHNLTSATAWFC